MNNLCNPLYIWINNCRPGVIPVRVINYEIMHPCSFMFLYSGWHTSEFFIFTSGRNGDSFVIYPLCATKDEGQKASSPQAMSHLAQKTVKDKSSLCYRFACLRILFLQTNRVFSRNSRSLIGVDWTIDCCATTQQCLLKFSETISLSLLIYDRT